MTSSSVTCWPAASRFSRSATRATRFRTSAAFAAAEARAPRSVAAPHAPLPRPAVRARRVCRAIDVAFGIVALAVVPQEGNHDREWMRPWTIPQEWVDPVEDGVGQFARSVGVPEKRAEDVQIGPVSHCGGDRGLALGTSAETRSASAGQIGSIVRVETEPPCERGVELPIPASSFAVCDSTSSICRRIAFTSPRSFKP